METWTPLTIFWVSGVLSAGTAIGALLISAKPITIRTLVGTVLFHGFMGGGLSIGLYEYFAWAKTPGRALFAAIAYGGGAITLPDIRTMALRVLGNDRPPANP
jgi:hypothetical protein